MNSRSFTIASLALRIGRRMRIQRNQRHRWDGHCQRQQRREPPPERTLHAIPHVEGTREWSHRGFHGRRRRGQQGRNRDRGRNRDVRRAQGRRSGIPDLHDNRGVRFTSGSAAAPTSTPQFLGAVIAFSNCIDASAFTGVQFTISGSFSGCTMQYATGDVEHQDMTLGSAFATGPAGSYPPQDRLAVDEMTSAPRTIKAPFVVSDIKGSPPAPLDPAS